jgi:hypothetical protein
LEIVLFGVFVPAAALLVVATFIIWVLVAVKGLGHAASQGFR